MNIKMFKTMLVRMHQRRPPILSLSGPGLGKTSAHRQVVEELSRTTGIKWEYCSLVLSNYDSFDIPGFLVPQRTQDNRFVSLMTEPFFWDRIAHWDGKTCCGILHLDEIMDCDASMQKLAAQMVFDRRVGLRYLPDGCWVLLSGNRRKDKSGVQRMTTMFQNRLRAIELEYNVDVLLEHERNEVGLNPLALAFIAQHPGLIYNDTVPADPGPFCSPRSFQESVLDLMHLASESKLAYPNLPGTDPTTDEGVIARKIMEGGVGAGVMSQFFVYLKYADQLATLDEIALDPASCKLPDSPGGQFMMAYTLGQMAKDQHLKPVIEYLFRMRVEFQVITMKALFDRANLKRELPTLTATPGVLQWVQKHDKVLKLSL